MFTFLLHRLYTFHTANTNWTFYHHEVGNLHSIYSSIQVNGDYFDFDAVIKEANSYFWQILVIFVLLSNRIHCHIEET